MAGKQSELCDVECIIKHRPASGKSVLVRLHEDAEGVFLPLSEIDIQEDVPRKGIATVTMPRWLAEKVGLV